MKNKNKLISGILLSVIILTIIPTISNAESGKPMMKNGPRSESFGTSTRMMNASSTIMKKQNNLNVMGVIGTVSSSSFTVNNIGRNSATTTYTVNVDASTVYRYGTTTSSFSAITTGKQVMVSGSLSTTTKIMTAKYVNIIDPNLRNRDINKYRPSSSTNPNANGMFHKMTNWFKNKFR